MDVCVSSAMKECKGIILEVCSNFFEFKWTPVYNGRGASTLISAVRTFAPDGYGRLALDRKLKMK